MADRENLSEHSSSQSEKIDYLQESQNMNQDEQALFLDIRKSRSNDSFLGKLIGTTSQLQNRSVILNISDFNPTKINSQSHENISTGPPPTLSIFKKVKKQKKHNKCDYQKNICGYITKKIIRQFIGPSFDQYVQNLCKKYYCSSEQVRKFYLSKIQYVTGPSHIPALLKPQKGDSQEIVFGKLAFRQFFDWFLRHRYVRYLMLEGKMTDKKAYIQYKNNVLFNFLEEDRESIQNLRQKLLFQKNQQRKLEEQLSKIRTISSKSGRSRSGRDKNIIILKNNMD